jgi:hypothetical protein
MRSRVVAPLVAFLVLIFLSGCGTMAGWVGIASSKSVDEKLAGTRSDLEAEVGSLRSDLDAYQAKASEIERLGRSIEETIRATEELQQLAEIMESRLQQLPRDTIEELVEILQRYLDEEQ